ncbi:MAG: reductive dehalogenase [archaeon]|nr:reductive dehalogenase [archaeon]
MGKTTAELFNLDPKKYSRFKHENNCFLRALYDKDFPSYQQDLTTNMTKLVDSGEKGFSRVDLALYAASWTVDKHMPFSTKWFPKPSINEYIPVEIVNRPPDDISPDKLTKYVKRAGRYLGASEVGITRIDENWLLKDTAKISGGGDSITKENIRSKEVILPNDVQNAIVFTIEMEPLGIRCAPGFLEVASVGLGYSQMTALSTSMAQFIRNLGYKAIPSSNDTGLSIPLAIDAGLGAYGRNGLMITKKFGPRIRICKVFTNMPLIHDEPDYKFIEKINDFCKGCLKCAENCEAKAISLDDEPTYTPMCNSNNPGVKKWYIHSHECYRIWVKYGTDCGNCIKVCPFSKTPMDLDPEEFWNL